MNRLGLLFFVVTVAGFVGCGGSESTNVVENTDEREIEEYNRMIKESEARADKEEAEKSNSR